MTDAWEPLYSKRDARRFVIGLRVAEAHCNARAMLHGGVLSTLCDNAMGIACALAVGEGTSLVTIHLSVDFLGAARAGQWVEIAAESTQPGRTIAFASAEVTADGALAGRATALFRVITRDAASSS
ncbi:MULTISPECIES: PaaI family thioesterase [Sphingopyxis]|uniref:PaaI family thioesterase n=1 Tax=Sphingopyxis TaxID=165697 RepID=UPI001BFCE090|nr:PaaI family thioesterase [Sphingopyxis sp.]HMO73915.1 PaaI family thioesterase [Sphingopyxis sp.]HMP43482.1 PaaI family thioesterase [Sphingopyxis sp.]HMQ19102.1 PaaI family thioesterase [Sphingopyxis sp.]